MVFFAFCNPFATGFGLQGSTTSCRISTSPYRRSQGCLKTTLGSED